MSTQCTQEEKKLLEHWLRTHFHSAAFNGRLQIGYRSAGSTLVLPMVTCERDKMFQLLLEDLILHSSVDYYITANTVCGVKRKIEQLFSLENIVIDVDCHQPIDVNEAGFDLLIDQILALLENNTYLPKPTSVVRTGRGIQLWWALVPCHAKCKPYYDEVKNNFMIELESILSEHNDLDCFSVDKTASSNAVGYFRIPGTTNTKVNKKVTFEVFDDDTIYVLQDLVDLVKEWADPVTPIITAKEPVMDKKDYGSKFSTQEITLLKNFHTLGFFRSGQLIKLRQIRDCPPGKEERNNFCFLMYNTLLPAFGHEKAMERLYLFNQGFKEPLSHAEIEGVICTAKRIKGYKYSNQKIIEFLNITPEEQEQISLYAGKFKSITGLSSHPSRKASAALVKENRNAQILQMAKTGKKGSEMARLLGVSEPTIRKVLREQGESLSTRLKEKIKNLFLTGMEAKEIAQECLCSVRTVLRNLEGLSLQ